jgi:hypothetical protein
MEEVIKRRPELPQGVTQWDEVHADHKLIAEWHEQQWANLGEVLEEY